MSKYGVISGLYFPVFRLNTEIYCSPNTGKYGDLLNPRIQSEYRKIWTRTNSVFGFISGRVLEEFPIQDVAFHEFMNRRGTKSPPHENLLHISHNDETWHSYTLPKKDPKYMNHMTYVLSSADLGIFYQNLAILVIFKNTGRNYIIMHCF